MDSTLLIN